MEKYYKMTYQISYKTFANCNLDNLQLSDETWEMMGSLMLAILDTYTKTEINNTKTSEK